MTTISKKKPSSKHTKMTFQDGERSPDSPLKAREPTTFTFTHFKTQAAAKISNDAVFCQKFSPDGSMVAASLLNGEV
jgi:hypothetical protein